MEVAPGAGCPGLPTTLEVVSRTGRGAPGYDRGPGPGVGSDAGADRRVPGCARDRTRPAATRAPSREFRAPSRGTTMPPPSTHELTPQMHQQIRQYQRSPSTARPSGPGAVLPALRPPAPRMLHQPHGGTLRPGPTAFSPGPGASSLGPGPGAQVVAAAGRTTR